MKNLICLLLVVIGCVTVNAQKVKVEANPNADLTKYKTYAWTKGMAVSNPHVAELITTAVDAELAKKGLTKLQSEEQADLVVVAWGSTESELYITKPSWAPSLNSLSTGVAAGAQTWPVTKGTLVIDLADTKAKSGVWRGTATHTLEHGPTGNPLHDAKTVEKPITKAVQKMFKKFKSGK
jgi:hypothetical protein